MKKIFALIFIAITLSSCACRHVVELRSLQMHDKLMSCTEITKAIGDADFYKREAEKVETDFMEVFFTPFCRLNSYSLAKKARKSADKRLDYLNKLYKLQSCDRNRSSNPRRLK